MTPGSTAHDALVRAGRALAATGRDTDVELVRAPSQANEAWLGPGYALRVNARGDLGRLAREARIVARLPPQARHPGVLECGDDGEIEWSFGPRVDGVPLARAWPDMTDAARARATRQLARALRAVHATEVPGDLAAIDPPHTTPLEPLLALCAELDQPEVAAYIRDRWAAFDGANRGLVHGDPHLENMLWDGRELTLLDFEWAQTSWLECDLEILASFADHPAWFVSEDLEARVRPEDFHAILGIFAEEHPALFSHPRIGDRLAVLHLSRVLGIIAEDPGPPDPRRLAQLDAILDGTSALLALRRQHR